MSALTDEEKAEITRYLQNTNRVVVVLNDRTPEQEKVYTDMVAFLSHPEGMAAMHVMPIDLDAVEPGVENVTLTYWDQSELDRPVDGIPHPPTRQYCLTGDGPAAKELATLATLHCYQLPIAENLV